jgi:flagellar biosynthesis protein FlhF
MRLKSFHAKTMTEAMQMVREALGEDAIIVATREERGGKSVRVTAAVEQPDDPYGSLYDDRRPRRAASSASKSPAFEIDTVDSPASAEDWLQYDEETEDENSVVEALTDVMLRHAVPEDITDHVISCATVIGMDRADESLTAALEHLFSFKPLPLQSKKPLMMVGPPGAGKTLATAKLAARSVMDGLKVAVITTDTVRAGGIEQLAAFTKLLRINLQKAADVKQLRQCLQEAAGADLILIDTGGINPFSPPEMKGLAQLIAAGNIEPVLVLPAAIDAAESGEIARVYSALGVRSLLPTRLDIARRLGGLLSAAYGGSLFFADASHTPQVAEGLVSLSPKRLTALLMPETARKTGAVSSPSKTARSGY